MIKYKKGSNRVGRGGCWDYDADYCRVAFRLSDSPSSRYSSTGFRVCRLAKGEC